MALKRVMIFEPKPDLTAHELAGALQLRLEYDADSEAWEKVPEYARRHFVVGLREGEEDEPGKTD